MFSEKAPFGVPKLYNSILRSSIKRIVSSKSFIIPPDDLKSVFALNNSKRDAIKIVAAILTSIDENGSYSLPVLKALNILYSGLKTDVAFLAEASKVFLPEIRTILFLSFNDKNDKYRDQIHRLVTVIYEFLAFNSPLPQTNDSVNTARQRGRSYSLTAKSIIPKAGSSK